MKDDINSLLSRFCLVIALRVLSLTQISCFSTSLGLSIENEYQDLSELSSFCQKIMISWGKYFTSFQKIVTTPNILTEVNSLANQLGEPERSHWFAIFTQGISSLDEFYIESRSVATSERFTKFGLTDCGILNLARDQYLVLTDDLKLALYLQKERIDTINFNNLRVSGWS